jgi:hypothetical protein
MRTITPGAFLLALALAVPAAAADDKPADMPTTPYYPLQVGNTWTYKVDYKADDDTRVTITVVKNEEFDKQPCARLETSGGRDKPRESEDVAVKADGVYRYAIGGKKVEPPVKILALPPKKDETWKIDAAVGTEKLKGSFKSEEVAEVKVPAGTYKDVVKISGHDIDANGVKLDLTYYFAKDFGIVKWVVKIDNKESVGELEKFEAAKQ